MLIRSVTSNESKERAASRRVVESERVETLGQVFGLTLLIGNQTKKELDQSACLDLYCDQRKDAHGNAQSKM